MKNRTLTLFLLFNSSIGLAHAEPVDFLRDIRPIFETRCYSCHGTEKQKGGLRLDVKAAALKGGDDHAPNILPGRPQESPLIKFVRGQDEDLVMPPKGKKLSQEQTMLLARWIEEGAHWPDGVDTARVEDKSAHWSLHPVSNPVPPVPKNTHWGRSELDSFILERLEREGLTPSPEADRPAWLRRVYFDLSGLPPSPEQLDSFLNDQTPDAYGRVVDALLKSPRYGERWGQHWLDVVRYADTHGFEVNTERPNAWPYRDYIIRAFNNDTPYDQFIRDQIAGDATGQDPATGFLVTASVLLPGQIGKDDASKRLARQDAIDEIVVNTSQTFLGLSVGCARCHDHKFDAISAKDYYAMQAFFAGVEYQDRDLHTPEAQAAKREAEILGAKILEIDKKLAGFVPLARTGAKRPAVNPKVNTDRFSPVKAKRVRFSVQKTNNLEPCIDELEVFNTDGVNVALSLSGARVTASGQTIVADRHDLNYINDGRYGNSRSWMGNENGKGSVVVEFSTSQTIERVVWGRDREGKLKDRLATDYQIEVSESGEDWRVVADSSDRIFVAGKEAREAAFSVEGLTPVEATQARALVAQKQPMSNQLVALNNAQKAFAGVFRAPDAIHLLYRGNPEQPKEAVSPAVLSVLGDLKLPASMPEQDRRVALAGWISDANNPLTARVMVNRIWQDHFGTGLVATPSDFGRMGLRPSHPELLDWLARDFVRNGWSMKSLHKKIVLSATYRQSSAYNEATSAKDAEARWLWRFPPRRLEAESLRDSILAVSGELNLKMYGRGFDLFNQRGGLSGFNPVEKFTGDGLRRMIYAHKVRREPEAVFGAFDCPDAGLSTSRRSESTTPIQALNLFNSRFILDQSEAFAARVKKEAGNAPSEQVQRAYLLAVGRPPEPAELSDALSVVAAHGAAAMCRAIFNSNEFVFVP